MIAWRIHHKAETVSTNLDAREGRPGDVFTADFQTAGRGRLDHKWLSPPGTNLMMSVVLSVEGLAHEQVATLPLVVGLAVAKAMPEDRVRDVKLKWPNDVLIAGKKIAGILCERAGEAVIAGIGVNVNQTEFSPEIAERATSLALLGEKTAKCGGTVEAARDDVLSELDKWYGAWREAGFAAVYPEIAAIDFLKGRRISVRQTDDDCVPLCGLSDGIMADGSLSVGGRSVYAGEAHVEQIA